MVRNGDVNQLSIYANQLKQQGGNVIHGAIRELCVLFEKNVFGGKRPYIIGTGGFARLFENYGIFDQIVPDLVLRGLLTALSLNA